ICGLSEMTITVVLFHMLYFYIIIFFFFFQAEDGIRDFHVTGVQTCALPIFLQMPEFVSDQQAAEKKEIQAFIQFPKKIVRAHLEGSVKYLPTPGTACPFSECRQFLPTRFHI